MNVGYDILLVVATLVAGLSIASIVASWVARRRPVLALLSLAIAIGLFAYVHVSLTDGLTWTDIPDSFILVAARLLN